MVDIEQQLSGLTFGKDIKMQLKSLVERTPEHKRLIETIMLLPGLTLKDKTR
mgnify:CR=1 FL=1